MVFLLPKGLIFYQFKLRKTNLFPKENEQVFYCVESKFYDFGWAFL